MMSKRLTKILILLASVQFIFTLDTTFMNVSISTLVKDLHTTVTGVQAAITFYTLVMAALMIAGAKVGDIVGRKRAFMVGLSIYAIGSLITSLSPNIHILILGWSVLEGVGAALAIPAMFSLITGNFSAGAERAKAYGLVAAMAAIGAAAGPIIGGLLTTYASWRLGFAAEVIIAAVVLFNRQTIGDAPIGETKPHFDWGGFALSAVGLVILVFGILLANTYGIFKARSDYSVFGLTIAHQGGVAPTVWLVIVGVVILAGFYFWELRQAKRAKPVLITPLLFRNRTVRAGGTSILMQQFMLAGALFSLSLILQIMLGYNAFQTGLTILPLSVTLLISASIGAKASNVYQPRTIVLTGFAILVVGMVWLGLRVEHLTSGLEFLLPLAISGVGIGFVASQLNNLIQTSVETRYTNEASGLSSTLQNLGSSLGTAIAGSVMIAVLISASSNLIAQNTTLTGAQKNKYSQVLQTQAQIVSNQQLEKALVGQPQTVVNTVVSINAQARDQALRTTVVVLGIIGALGLITAWRLPRRPIAEELAA